MQLESRPFIRWVGGKTRVLKQLITLLPKELNNYFEPFLGGGALFFKINSLGLLENNISLSDINSELINAYTVVKDNPGLLIERLKIFNETHSKELFYKTRALDRKDNFLQISDIDRASRFIYLNKQGFHGMYRVNKKNQNTVAMGKFEADNICDKETIYKASKSLQGIVIVDSSYEKVLKNAKKGDFIYLDPPYHPVSKTSFTKYYHLDFLVNQQNKLFSTFAELSNRGCYLMQSNSNTEFIRDLYKDFNINIIENRRLLSKQSNRIKVNEFVIRNYA